MVFRSIHIFYVQGIEWWRNPSGYYCTNYDNDNATCTVSAGKAILFCPSCTSPKCVSDGTCILVKGNYTVTIYSLPSGKQGILNSLFSSGRIVNGYGFPHVYDTITPWDTSIFYVGHFSSDYFKGEQATFYNPVTNAIITDYWDSYGRIIRVEAQRVGLFFGELGIIYQFGSASGYYISGHLIFISYEASPELVMPIDRDEYVLTQELKDVVGWSISGYAQVGWNADDILRVVQSLYPDRPWVVYDDRTLTAHANGLELDDVVELINLGVLRDVTTVYSYNTDKISRKDVEDFLNFYRAQRSQPPQQAASTAKS